MEFMKVTESPSKYSALEDMPLGEILKNINQEDASIAEVVENKIHAIQSFVQVVIQKVKAGGRLFYIGAGTSGRLGVLDASECPPTFGVDRNTVVGVIAGGDSALRIAKEGAEDDLALAWNDLQTYQLSKKDVVLGIASSGSTPYVLGGLNACREAGITTGALVCNPGSPIARVADFAIEIIVGPEFITGSTRMKAGTAQKMVLNMISTTLMIKLGKIKGNKMVDMHLSNKKLYDRGLAMLITDGDMSVEEASQLLSIHGSVRKVLEMRMPHLKQLGADTSAISTDFN